MSRILQFSFPIAPLVVIVLSLCCVAEEPLSYDRDIRPILSENCFACHGFDENAREAGLRLDTREGAVDDGAIDPASPESSLIVARIVSTDADELMPPPRTGKSISPEQLATIKRWIAEGAAYEQHWAFIPPTVAYPAVPDSVRHPVDAFVADKLAELGVTPSPLAPAATLMRRLSLDLTGLPPSPEDVLAFELAFENDPQRALASTVDRLLNSPHFGERWGRWWLDQARYADSHGYSIDGEREMWNYRDWVIDAINQDMSFDQFTIEQLAGDLLPGATVSQRIATGFHRNTQINQEGGVDPEQFRMDSVFDRVATTGNVWLGLSIGCAQCHDHKFDPLTQVEYYQLFAFLNNQEEPNLTVYPTDVDAPGLEQEKRQVEQYLNEVLASYDSALKDWEASLDETARQSLDKSQLSRLSKESEKRSVVERANLLLASGLMAEDITSNEGVEASDDCLSPNGLSPNGLSANDSAQADAVERALERHADIATQLGSASRALVLAERADVRPTAVLIKGDFTRPDAVVDPGTPAVLPPLATNTAGQRANRLDLARWLVADDNPLTPRVISNRVWQQLFGRGIVETENDFGLQGSPPSHPELLDWLAVDFREHGWSLKHLIRNIVTSQTYLQSSVVRAELDAVDPLNILLGRQNRLRLDAEIVRDVALVSSGLFCAPIGGPSVRPPIPEGVMSQGQVRRSWNVDHGSDRYRRAMYTFAYRVTPPPYLSVFDAPDGLSSCTRRIRSNTPLQALTLLNDPAFVEFATAMEEVIRREGLAMAFQRVTSRRPLPDEIELLEQLHSLNAARALLNLDETITRE